MQNLKTMDVTAFVSDNNFFSPLYLLLTPLLILFIIKQTKSLYSNNNKNLPPGPSQWPIIGNIHQVGRKPHVSTATFAQEYGPLISLRLGTQILVVASSPEAAMGILKTQDRLLSSRFVPNAFHHSFLPFSLIWSTECNENWKSLRTLCRTEMFSAKAIETQSGLREEKLGEMLSFLRRKQGQVVNIEEVVFTTIFNTLSNIIFGKDFLDLEDEHGTAGGLKGTLFKILEHGIAPNISDFFPMFAGLDLQGLRKGSLKHMKEVFSFWEGIIKERRAQIASASSLSEKCFLDQLLQNGFSNDQINLLALELFTAGTDTTTSTIEWTMAELLKNKEAMSKVEEELHREINSDTITASQLSKLPYLNACIKETLRLHPPAPFLLPHRALKTCEVLNYTIPENAQILVNIWAVGRDPKIWGDPQSFRPERFLDTNLDFRGQDFEFIPFGAGRRMCPGLPSGVSSVQHILASLIHGFDWVLPNGEDPRKLDMNDKFGVTLQKEKPLKLIFKHKPQSILISLP